MDPIEKRELKRKAWMRLAAQKRRAGMLRGRVLAVSLICFAVLWVAVFAQMETGNDPALASKKAGATSRTVASAKKEVETTDPREVEPKAEAVEVEPETEALEPESEEFEAEPEAEEFEAEEFEPEPEVVESEPEVVEVEPEPLVTSQS